MDGQTSLGSGSLGAGLAQNAAILEQYRQPYMRMAEQMQLQGQDVPPFEQWASQQHAMNQPQNRRGLIQALFDRIRG